MQLQEILHHNYIKAKQIIWLLNEADVHVNGLPVSTGLTAGVHVLG